MNKLIQIIKEEVRNILREYRGVGDYFYDGPSPEELIGQELREPGRGKKDIWIAFSDAYEEAKHGNIPSSNLHLGMAFRKKLTRSIYFDDRPLPEIKQNVKKGL